MRRPVLMFLLSLGVLFGFGSGIASLRYRMHHGCHSDWRGDRWSDARGDWRRARDADVKAPAPAPQPQTVVVQSPAPAAAPAPQVFVIMPQGVATPQVVTVPVPTPAAAPSVNVAPPANAP